MSESSIREARQAVNTAMATLRAESSSVTGQELIDQLQFLKTVIRQAEHDSLHTVARLDREGEFAERGVRPAPAVADLLRCRETEARRLVAVAASVFPTSLRGEPLEPRLPATAMALGGWEIDQAHAEVIERVLRSDAAARLDPRLWANVETQLADLARIYRPDQLAGLARDWIEQLDQDGPAPDEGEPLVNELHLAKSRHGGGQIKGRLDASTFEVVARAIRAILQPATDQNKSLGERQADALGAICEHALDDGYLPHEGGERPHITTILPWEWMQDQAHGATLEFGGQTTAGELRRLMCDAKITPVVLGGDSQPLDVGREKRCVTLAQRKAVAARDRGCAHPGCDRAPSWCQVHHIKPWAHHGESDIINLVMLCRQHHVRHEALFVPNGGERPLSVAYRGRSLKLRAA